MKAQSDSSDFLYSNKDHKRIRHLLTVQLNYMTFMGQTPYIMESFFPPILRRLGWFLSYLYSGFIIMQTSHTGILFVKTTFDMLQFGELNEITDALTQVIICSFSCFSTCYWLWHMDALRKFIDYINTNYWHHSLTGLTFVSSFGVYVRARRLTIYWITSGLLGTCFWGIAPLLQGSHTLPLNCWYPFDPLRPWVYLLIYALQMFTQVNIGITFCCGSALYVSLIILLLGQYDILYCSLKNVQQHARLLSGESLEELRKLQLNLPSSKDMEVNQYMFSKEELTDLSSLYWQTIVPKQKFQEALHDTIVQCVKLHQFIWQSCKKLEELYHPYCLLKSLQITMQLCLLVFVGVAGERSIMRVFNLFQYMTLTLIELVMFTFFGELLRQHSVRSTEALSRSDWPSFSTLVRKDILIFMINSQRPVRLTAGKFFPMDIERLRSVITQAFSFLTLLQKLEAKSN